jgi:hypothetical protein
VRREGSRFGVISGSGAGSGAGFGSGAGSGFGSGSGPKSPWLKYIVDEGFCLKYKGCIC